MKKQLKNFGGIFLLGVTFNVHLGGVHAISGYPDSFELRKIKKS
jgi:hypothetical protein